MGREIKKEKEEIRRSILKKRSDLDPLQRKRYSFVIQEKAASILEQLRPVKVVTYVSYQSEVETLTLISWMLEKGIEVFVPVTEPGKRGFEISRVKRIVDLQPGYKGIPVPREATPEKIIPDAVICPGVAFDRDGWRIGYGGGNFDVFLQSLPEKTYKLGLAFSLQIIDRNLPLEDHDSRVDALITEKEIIIVKPFS